MHMLILSLTRLFSFGFLKVYIVRARNFTEIDEVTSLLNLNSHADPINGGTIFHLNLTCLVCFIPKNRIYIFTENDLSET